MALTQKVIQNITIPAKYPDKYGLSLRVSPGGAKAWIVRYTLNGKRRDDGLGKFPEVSLEDARARAMEIKLLSRKGIDPRDVKAQKALADQPVITFLDDANAYIERHRKEWSQTHTHQWEASLRDHVFDLIGSKPVADIDTKQVTKVLDVIWRELPETARRVRNRIERVLEYSTAMGHRTGENPARWQGHLRNIMPNVLPAPVPLEAMDYVLLPDFMLKLDAEDSRAARCLQFLILTGCRTAEAIGARWDEIDFEHAVWSIPAERMKGKELHQVPLSDAALAVIKEVGTRGKSDFIFSNRDHSKSLAPNALRRLMKTMNQDCTVHGFRSTFRTWLQEKTDFSHDLCEICLAHVVGNATSRTYTRSNQLEKRKPMMEKWGRFAIGKTVAPRPVQPKPSARTPLAKASLRVGA